MCYNAMDHSNNVSTLLRFRMTTLNPIISINFSVVANLIPVHYGLQNGGEWRHAYSGGNENSMMSSKNVTGRCTIAQVHLGI